MLSFRPVGFDDERAAEVRARLEQELAASGLSVRVAEGAGAECFDDASCVSSLAGGAGAVVDFEAVRVGPLVQVSARLFDGAGALVDAKERTAEAAAFPGEEALLDPELLKATLALAPPAPAGAAPPTEEVELVEGATPAEPDDPAAMPVLGYSGIGVAVLGGGLILGGAVLALAQDGVLADAKSTREEKDLALALVPTGLVLSGLGVLTLSAGGALATLGFAGE